MCQTFVAIRRKSHSELVVINVMRLTGASERLQFCDGYWDIQDEPSLNMFLKCVVPPF